MQQIYSIYTIDTIYTIYNVFTIYSVDMMHSIYTIFSLYKMCSIISTYYLQNGQFVIRAHSISWLHILQILPLQQGCCHNSWKVL